MWTDDAGLGIGASLEEVQAAHGAGTKAYFYKDIDAVNILRDNGIEAETEVSYSAQYNGNRYEQVYLLDGQDNVAAIMYRVCSEDE